MIASALIGHLMFNLTSQPHGWVVITLIMVAATFVANVLLGPKTTSTEVYITEAPKYVTTTDRKRLEESLHTRFPVEYRGNRRLAEMLRATPVYVVAVETPGKGVLWKYLPTNKALPRTHNERIRAGGIVSIRYGSPRGIHLKYSTRAMGPRTVIKDCDPHRLEDLVFADRLPLHTDLTLCTRLS